MKLESLHNLFVAEQLSDLYVPYHDQVRRPA